MSLPLRVRPLGLAWKSFPRSSPTTIGRQCRVPSSRSYATSDRLPKIADTSVWTAMIPRFIRQGKSRKPGEKKEWNPATFYIVMFTLIGSQAIRMLTLKNGYASYSRSADAKIELLKEVIERVKKGEKVDVEKLLGTGDEAQEKEWEEVLKQIEQEDALWNKQKQAEQEQKQPTPKLEEKETVASTATSTDDEAAKKAQKTRKMNFF
ncbi:hypothetical protein N7462_000318 [Penicillium macrosclerotiorum]|uniref:uncharacterized protein n=1 Tax=Penicillium macrosclerotiorum TaxID=303699 RepID=UPI0025489DE0|nr:uncharacterized protein N7462_000318 [Penicillium macrosclerotiorum]KAJ5698313.1 hypothetical protein N7462_000318 [Penicillium macrosclerotiorum]